MLAAQHWKRTGRSANVVSSPSVRLRMRSSGAGECRWVRLANLVSWRAYESP
jgi:hypothetical protein